MTRNITDLFKTFKSNLEITGSQTSVVSVRQENVRAVLNDGLDLLDSFLTGSYSRSTMIAPLKDADIDLFVVLDPKYYNLVGQVNLLDKVRTVLLKTYTRTPEISRNGQAVTITFNDFLVDVVPAFNRRGGGFIIPDSKNSSWIETDPKFHVDLTSQENLVHNYDLVPIIKMIKGWNRKNNYPFVSFYLELLAIKIFKNITISDYPSGVRYFFDKGREAIKYKIKDPVEFGGFINPLRNCTTVEDAVERFEIAFERSKMAEEYALSGDLRNAADSWNKLFGDYFPIY